MEVKGFCEVVTTEKAQPVKSFSMPGANDRGGHERWAFSEFTEV